MLARNAARFVALVPVLLLGCARQQANPPATDSVTAVFQWPPRGLPAATVAFSPDFATIRTLSAQDTEPVVRRVLGNPDSMRAYDDSLKGETTELFYHTAKVILSGGRLHEFYCFGSDCKNKDGIGVGTPVAVVLRSMGAGEYGPDSAKRQLRYSIPERNCLLVFSFDPQGTANEMNFVCRKR